MDDERAGRIIRAVRVERRLRQVDVGRLAGVDQKVVSTLELGRISNVSVRRLRRVCEVLGIFVRLDLRWQGGTADRLIDRGHAAIVEIALAELRLRGWEPIPEYTFNHFGERGSVDILAWHSASGTLLLIEVKTALTDLQALLMSMSRKIRVVPALVQEERGWQRAALGRLLVVAGTRANRTIVERHSSMFEATFPARTIEVGRWLRRPAGDLAGIWFVAPRRALPAKTARTGRVRAVRAQTAGSAGSAPSAQAGRS
jgi:transcriptional regulator with XRE-family HTH domain